MAVRMHLSLIRSKPAEPAETEGRPVRMPQVDDERAYKSALDFECRTSFLGPRILGHVEIKHRKDHAKF
jgi:hypothetical protein